ncbi:MCE family protein [Nocardia sp. NPDC052254]|uniref:MlaD family protein n=1 Tax=Nocardia sp. NPDC052254 TaxID=3155681 RepID=UPI00343E3187
MILDPSGRGATARQLTLSGIAMLLVLATLMYLLVLRYTGHFTEKVPVAAILTSTGDGLPSHADVKFRGLVVGSVDSVEVVAKGQRQRAEIGMKPRVVETIPANVTARVIPSNLFGVTAVELVDNGPDHATLRSGSTIQQDTGAATIQLQTTLDVLRNVLTNIQPEKLGRVLATLSAALEPSARVPGSTIERLDNWLTQVHDIPGIGDLLGNLGRAAGALSQSAPELVGVLSDSVTTARTLTERRSNLVALLTDAGGAIDAVNGLFARNPDSGKYLVSGLDDLFGGLARDPDAIPFTAANLNTALQRLKTTFHWGPEQQMVWAMDASLTPFQQYTAADCPHYGDRYGPRCGGASVPDVAPAQQYPAQQLPRWLDAAGPPPVPAAIPAAPAQQPLFPGLPVLPGFPALPGIPGLPQIPGITAPAADRGGAAGPGVRPVALRGPAAVAAVVGGVPNMAQLLLLGPILAGGYLTVGDAPEGGVTQ